jgi:hypothetical protein
MARELVVGDSKVVEACKAEASRRSIIFSRTTCANRSKNGGS